MRELLNDAQLERSEIVANNLMNRERLMRGGNSYEKELRFNILEFLLRRIDTGHEVAWLDLCCGTGAALIQGAEAFVEACYADQVDLVGVDLIPGFLKIPPERSRINLVAVSLPNWRPGMTFDLITCVHGLHYIGDKLGTIEMAVSSLKTDGLFMGHLDFDNLRIRESGPAENFVKRLQIDPEKIRIPGVRRSGNPVKRLLMEAGFEYKDRQRILRRAGNLEMRPFWHYLGADDKAGRNFTWKPAVNSHYELRAHSD